MTFSYAEENRESRRRLEGLVRRLTEQDLARSTEYGWTVATLMADTRPHQTDRGTRG